MTDLEYMKNSYDMVKKACKRYNEKIELIKKSREEQHEEDQKAVKHKGLIKPDDLS